MPAPAFQDTPVIGAFNPVAGNVAPVPSHQAINEKVRQTVDIDAKTSKEGEPNADIKAAPPFDHDRDGDGEGHDVIIITGTDAATHLLSLRDDEEPSLTFRCFVLGTILSAFQAVMSQIYYVSCYSMLCASKVDLHAQHRLIPRLVQTYLCQRPGHFHRHHCLLSR